jgi:hypothetical protein
MWQTFKDWCWWKFVIKEDEFHHKLNLDFKKIMEGKTTLEKEQERIAPLRERAHKLDMKWG